MCVLDKALYGHPEAGCRWEGHFARILVELGYREIAEHPGTWGNRNLDAILVVYVDDLLLACCIGVQRTAWDAIAAKVEFKEGPAAVRRYLGAYYTLARQGASRRCAST